MNDEPSDPGSCWSGWVTLLLISYAIKGLMVLSKHPPQPPPVPAKIPESVKAIFEADDANYRSQNGAIKAAIRIRAALYNRRDVDKAVRYLAVSPEDGKLTAHLTDKFTTSRPDEQDKVMEAIVRVWHASPYVQKHGYSGAVEFAGPNNWKREFAAPKALRKPTGLAAK